VSPFAIAMSSTCWFAASCSVGGDLIPCISDIEVAGSVLLCDVDVGQPASSRPIWSEDGFAASRQVLFGQGSELVAHVI
jgi:hypothetical protein